MSGDTCEQILEALGDQALTSEEIFARCKDVDRRELVSKALWNMRQRGEITRDKDNRYRRAAINGKKHAAAGKAVKVIIENKGSYRVKVSDVTFPNPAMKHRAILMKLVEQTQGALDEYLYSVGDEQVLKPLIDARNSARRALLALGGSGDQASSK
jgi:glutamate synthase domain-containing protein 1